MNAVWPRVAAVFLLFLVVIAVFTTVIIAIMERKKEIGTLLALGTKYYEICLVFILEKAILSTIAAGVEALLALGVIYSLSLVGIPAVGEMMKFMFGGEALYFTVAWPEIV